MQELSIIIKQRQERKQATNVYNCYMICDDI
jgi:hypothetical protein